MLNLEVSDALKKFVRDSIRRHARKAVYKLQRIPDCGAHPYGWDMRSLWSLYSWEVQNGPSENMDLIDDLVSEIVEQIVQAIPQAEADLLLTQSDPDDEEGGRGIFKDILDELSLIASKRNLDRYDPDYRWYDDY